jgi:hypothetical protein
MLAWLLHHHLRACGCHSWHTANNLPPFVTAAGANMAAAAARRQRQMIYTSDANSYGTAHLVQHQPSSGSRWQHLWLSRHQHTVSMQSMAKLLRWVAAVVPLECQVVLLPQPSTARGTGGTVGAPADDGSSSTAFGSSSHTPPARLRQHSSCLQAEALPHSAASSAAQSHTCWLVTAQADFAETAAAAAVLRLCYTCCYGQLHRTQLEEGGAPLQEAALLCELAAGVAAAAQPCCLAGGRNTAAASCTG